MRISVCGKVVVGRAKGANAVDFEKGRLNRVRFFNQPDLRRVQPLFGDLKAFNEGWIFHQAVASIATGINWLRKTSRLACELVGLHLGLVLSQSEFS